LHKLFTNWQNLPTIKASWTFNNQDLKFAYLKHQV
jgi:hypothetical protein